MQRTNFFFSLKTFFASMPAPVCHSKATIKFNMCTNLFTSCNMYWWLGSYRRWLHDVFHSVVSEMVWRASAMGEAQSAIRVWYICMFVIAIVFAVRWDLVTWQKLLENRKPNYSLASARQICFVDDVKDEISCTYDHRSCCFGCCWQGNKFTIVLSCTRRYTLKFVSIYHAQKFGMFR